MSILQRQCLRSYSILFEQLLRALIRDNFFVYSTSTSCTISIEILIIVCSTEHHHHRIACLLTLSCHARSSTSLVRSTYRPRSHEGEDSAVYGPRLTCLSLMYTVSGLPTSAYSKSQTPLVPQIRSGLQSIRQIAELCAANNLQCTGGVPQATYSSSVALIRQIHGKPV